MTDIRTSAPSGLPQDVHAALDDDDDSYTWEREPVQPVADEDRGMVIAAYVVCVVVGIVLGMVAMRLLTWVWA